MKHLRSARGSIPRTRRVRAKRSPRLSPLTATLRALDSLYKNRHVRFRLSFEDDDNEGDDAQNDTDTQELDVVEA